MTRSKGQKKKKNSKKEHQVLKKKKIAANVSEEEGLESNEAGGGSTSEDVLVQYLEAQYDRHIEELKRRKPPPVNCWKLKGIFLSSGYVFRPTDEIIVDYYLRKMTFGIPFESDFCPILEIQVYTQHPQSLIVNSKDTREPVWYFFTRSRPNQTEQSKDIRGHWIFGEKEDIINQNEKVGVKQVVEYFEGGCKSEYKIMEYQLYPAPDDPKTGLWFICKLYKDGAAAQNPP